MVNAAVLYSGGKDSTYAAYLAEKRGHKICCLATAVPDSAESMLLHHPNSALTQLQAQAAGMPHIMHDADSENELDSVKSLLARAASEYGAVGAVHGGIASVFQKKQFEEACVYAGLEPISPVWGTNPKEYMHRLLSDGFSYIITAVSSGGLDESWLGRNIDSAALEELAVLSARHGFNLNFEGGEAETLVLGCPMFSHSIRIEKSHTVWDGYRGIFEIEAAGFGNHARWAKNKPAGGP